MTPTIGEFLSSPRRLKEVEPWQKRYLDAQPLPAFFEKVVYAPAGGWGEDSCILHILSDRGEVQALVSREDVERMTLELETRKHSNTDEF